VANGIMGSISGSAIANERSCGNPHAVMLTAIPYYNSSGTVHSSRQFDCYNAQNAGTNEVPSVLRVAPHTERGREDSPVSAPGLAPSILGCASRHFQWTISIHLAPSWREEVTGSQLSAHNWAIKMDQFTWPLPGVRPGTGSQFSAHRFRPTPIDPRSASPVVKAQKSDR
jgi:hypothetical protein